MPPFTSPIASPTMSDFPVFSEGFSSSALPSIFLLHFRRIVETSQRAHARERSGREKGADRSLVPPPETPLGSKEAIISPERPAALRGRPHQGSRI